MLPLKRLRSVRFQQGSYKLIKRDRKYIYNAKIKQSTRGHILQIFIILPWFMSDLGCNMKKTMLKSLNHMGLTWRPDCMKC